MKIDGVAVRKSVCGGRSTVLKSWADRRILTRLGHRRVLPKTTVVLLCKPRDILPGFRYRVPGLAGEWSTELLGKPVGIRG
jgi:hypothetical protein